MIKPWTFICALLVQLVLGMLLVQLRSAQALNMPSKQPVSRDWQLIAESDIIADAELHLPVMMLKQLQKEKKHSDLKLSVDIRSLAKGSSEQSSLIIRKYVGFEWFARRPATLAYFAGKEVMIFLFYDDEPGCEGIYFTDRGPSAIRRFNKTDFQSVKDEVVNQQQILRHFQEIPIARADATDGKVRSLLTELTKNDAQDNAWQELLKLPRSSVPALIRAMNDDRELGHPSIKIEVPPRPHRFEEIAHYGPKTVLDAVSILVGDKTETSFGQIFNGGSGRERQTVLNAWRVWAYYSTSAKIGDKIIPTDNFQHGSNSGLN